jgi:hypothetical protein
MSLRPQFGRVQRTRPPVATALVLVLGAVHESLAADRTARTAIPVAFSRAPHHIVSGYAAACGPQHSQLLRRLSTKWQTSADVLFLRKAVDSCWRVRGRLLRFALEGRPTIHCEASESKPPAWNCASGSRNRDSDVIDQQLEQAVLVTGDDRVEQFAVLGDNRVQVAISIEQIEVCANP